MGDKTKEQELDSTILEKSWNAACTDLQKSLGDEASGTTELERAKAILAKSDASVDELKEAQTILTKALPPEDDDDEEDDEEEEEEEEGKKPAPVKKSLEEGIAEGDPEAEIAMDIEPYLKSFAHEVGVRFEEIGKPLTKLKALEKSLADLTTIVRALAKVSLVGAEMQKSLNERVGKIGSVDIPSLARLRKGGDRFDIEEGVQMTGVEIMAKATELCRNGRISTTDVAVLESRIQKGVEIPDNLKPLFAKKA
jgi:hypothetical protein